MGVRVGILARSAETARRVELAKRDGALVGALLLYLGFACYLTWPLVPNLSHSIYGSLGDPFGTMSFYRQLVDHHHNPFLPGTITQLGAPAGTPIPWLRDLASMPGVLTLYLLTAAFGPIAAYGVYTLFGYVLTGLATFLLARRITANVLASLLGGWVFAFFPYAAINGQYHPDLIQGWVLVAAVWRMLELLWRPTLRNGILAGLATLFAMWWTAYFILLLGVGYVAITTVALALAAREHRLREALRPQAAAALIVLGFALFLVALWKVGGGAGTGAVSRSLHDLYTYGARPSEYLAPDAHSVLFGWLTGHYAATHQYGAGMVEATLYLGVTLLALAGVAVFAWLRGALTVKASRAVAPLSALAICCAVVSMPPSVGVAGVSFPFPSRLITDFTTTWRIYTRFVTIVMLALAILAVIGVDYLTRGRPQAVRFVITLLLTAIVVLDLWAPQRGHVLRIKRPGIYAALERLPAGLVAEYPMAKAGLERYRERFNQSYYRMPTINGYEEGTSAEMLAFSLASLAQPGTVGRLAALGVKYVVLNKFQETTSWIASTAPATGLHLIAETPEASLYAVDAKPQSPVVVAPGQGFIPDQFSGEVPVAGLATARGEIQLRGSCAPCQGTLTMLIGVGSLRHEVVIASGRRTLLRAKEEGLNRLLLSVSFDRHLKLTIATYPGPPPENPQISGRFVSLTVQELEFVAAKSTPPQGGANRTHSGGRTQ